MKSKDVDTIARNDYLVSINKILEVTNSREVQVLCHCVGSLSFFMAMALGLLAGKIKCIATSSVALHPIPGTLKRVEAYLHFPGTLNAAGVHSVNPTADGGAINILTSTQIASGAEPDQHCDSVVCHRIMDFFTSMSNLQPLSTIHFTNILGQAP